MAGPEQIWAEAVRTLELGKPFALATVVNVRGSTPREVGAKMIVRDDGQFGTIGGGCGEAEVFRKAKLLLEEGQGARLTEVDLTGDFEQEQIGVCGGIMDVFIDLWSPRNDLAIARKLADAAGRNAPAALVTIVDPGTAEAPRGARSILEPDSSEKPAWPIELAPAASAKLAECAREAVSALVELADGELKPVTHIERAGGPRIFLDPVAGSLRLIIVGAGHIGQPLARFGSVLGFRVIVIDDRGAFANRERFPTADEIIVAPFEQAIDALKLDRFSYMVAITRGHAFDEQAVRAALKQPCGFVGMIGSRRRVRTTLERLEHDGVARALLDRVHAPLGLDIGAEMPEEIALAIIAEIVRERRLGIRDEMALGVKLGRLKKSA